MCVSFKRGMGVPEDQETLLFQCFVITHLQQLKGRKVHTLKKETG